MFTIRLEKYKERPANIQDYPCEIDQYSIREARTVHLRREADGRQVLQINDAPADDCIEVTVGARSDCTYSVVYVMNSAGKTVDKIC